MPAPYRWRPVPTTQELLDEAKTARHALLVGKQSVSVGYGERSIQFSKSDLPALERYIRELQSELTGKRPTRNRVRYGIPD